LKNIKRLAGYEKAPLAARLSKLINQLNPNSAGQQFCQRPVYRKMPLKIDGDGNENSNHHG